MIRIKDTCPEDINAMLMRHARDVHRHKLAKKHEIEELRRGVRFEPMKAMLKRKSRAQARSWVFSGACANKSMRQELGGQRTL